MASFLSFTMSFKIILLQTVLFACTRAFVLPNAALVAPSRASVHHALPLLDQTAVSDQLKMLDASVDSTLSLPSIVDTSSSVSSTILTADALDLLRNFFIIIGGIVAVLAVGAIAFSAWIVPQAAAELEKQIKERDPALWEEYQDKLEEGEVLAMRPELMQELGDRYQKMVMEEFDAQEMATAKETSAKTSRTGGTVTSPSTNNKAVLDAEIVDSDKDD